LSIGLCWRYELADDLEDEISALVVHVSSIKQTLELWIDLQPAVSIPIGLMADAVRLTTVCCVNDSSRNGNARLLYDQSMRLVNVLPQSIVALRSRRIRGFGLMLGSELLGLASTLMYLENTQPSIPLLV